MGSRPVGALVLADTHLRAGDAGRFVETLRPQLTAADVILHAGDIVDAAVLSELSGFAPVHAVLGNNDHGVRLPERRVVEVGGCQIAMVHESGPSAGRAARLRRWFPDADVVVFGHSHLPWHEIDVGRDSHEQHHLNPGSATQRRRAPTCTIAWVTCSDGKVLEVVHEDVQTRRRAVGAS